jgi:hypothetical protein
MSDGEEVAATFENVGANGALEYPAQVRSTPFSLGCDLCDPALVVRFMLPFRCWLTHVQVFWECAFLDTLLTITARTFLAASTQASLCRKGAFLMVKAHACKVIEMTISKVSDYSPKVPPHRPLPLPFSARSHARTRF